MGKGTIAICNKMACWNASRPFCYRSGNGRRIYLTLCCFCWFRFLMIFRSLRERQVFEEESHQYGCSTEEEYRYEAMLDGYGQRIFQRGKDLSQQGIGLVNGLRRDLVVQRAGRYMGRRGSHRE